MIDELLKRYNIKEETMSKEEWQSLSQMATALQQGQLTVEKIRYHITSLRAAAEKDLTTKKEGQINFLSLLVFLIPIVGVIRKWYQDQAKLEVEARLRCYLVIEQMLYSPERARKQLESTIATMANGEG